MCQHRRETAIEKMQVAQSRSCAPFDDSRHVLATTAVCVAGGHRHDCRRKKYGLKLNINAIVLCTIKLLKGMYAESMDDTKVAELDISEKIQFAIIHMWSISDRFY